MGTVATIPPPLARDKAASYVGLEASEKPLRGEETMAVGLAADEIAIDAGAAYQSTLSYQNRI